MTRIKFLTFLLLIPFSFKLIAQQQNKEVNSYIAKVQKQYNIPGLALAVIKDGEVIHKKITDLQISN